MHIYIHVLSREQTCIYNVTSPRRLPMQAFSKAIVKCKLQATMTISIKRMRVPTHLHAVC